MCLYCTKEVLLIKPFQIISPGLDMEQLLHSKCAVALQVALLNIPPRCRKCSIALLLLISVIMLMAHHTYDCQILLCVVYELPSSA